MTEKLTDQDIRAWAREQFQKANKYLAEQGVLFESVITEECRYLAPIVALWKIKAMDSKVYWVLTGDVNIDAILADNAGSAREAMKYFSMRWQLQAEQLEEQNTVIDESQTKYIAVLRAHAEYLYAMQEKEELWA